MSEQLKACPFCGGAPALEDHRLIWAVRCGCGVCMLGERAPEPTRAMSEKYWRRFEQSAVDAWNRRAEDFDTLAQRLQEAERLLTSVIKQFKADQEIRGGIPVRWKDLLSESDAFLASKQVKP